MKTKLSGKTASDMCSVRLDYKNKNLEIISQREYSFEDYAELLRSGLTRLILDVEDLAYRATDAKSKEEWPDDVMSSFNRIRHKLLDMAGEVHRLSDNLVIEQDEEEIYMPMSPQVEPMRFTSGRDEKQAAPSWDFLKFLIPNKERGEEHGD